MYKSLLVGSTLIPTFLALSLAQVPLQAATFTVTNTNPNGAGSLQQAIIDANTTPGLDTITFNISGTSEHTINMAGTGLPPITEAINIDGSTQPGYVVGNPRVTISNTSLLAGFTTSLTSFAMTGLSFTDTSINLNAVNISINHNILNTIDSNTNISIRDAISGNISNNSLTGGTGISCNNCSNLTITGNTLNQAGIGFSGDVHSNNVITNNNVSGRGINFLNGTNTNNTISENTLDQSGIGLLNGTNNDNTITNNTITNASGAIALLSPTPSNNNLIRGNSIQNSTNAININAGSDNLITDNEVVDSTRGVVLNNQESLRNTISDNNFLNIGDYISIYQANANIQPPTFTVTRSGDNFIISGTAKTGSSIELLVQSGQQATPAVTLVEGSETDADPGTSANDSFGNPISNFTFTVPTSFIPNGENIIATSTDPNGYTSDTSQPVPLPVLDNQNTQYLVRLSQRALLPDGQSPILPGHRVRYIIDVTNVGNADVSDTYLIDVLPTNTTPDFNSLELTTGTYDASNSRWNIGPIAVGQTHTLIINVEANQDTWGQTISNTSVLYENDPDFQSNGNIATVTTNIQVATQNLPQLTLTSSTPQTNQGEAVTFTATMSDPSYNGTVTFYNGSTPLGTGELVNGVATITTQDLPAGIYDIRATYYLVDEQQEIQATTQHTVINPNTQLNSTDTTTTNPTGQNMLADTGANSPTALLIGILVISLSLIGFTVFKTYANQKSSKQK